MTIKDKRDAVVEAAKDYAAGSFITTGPRLVDRVRELEAAETPLQLEGVVTVESFGVGMSRGAANVRLRGQLGHAPDSGLLSVDITECGGVVDTFRHRGFGFQRFRLVLTEIMDDAS